MLTDSVDAAPGLKVVSNVAVAYGNFDLAAAKSREVLLGNTPGVLTEAFADFVFALRLAAARAGGWGPWYP